VKPQNGGGTCYNLTDAGIKTDVMYNNDMPKNKRMTLKMVANLGKKIRKGKCIVGETVDRNTGKITDLAGNTIKRIGKKK
jgi:hypothetical protein